MSSESTIMVESHRSAATLYASGELTADGVLRAIAQVEQLPNHVRALCVDLRALYERPTSRALRALEIALRDWRAARRGMSRVRFPEHPGGASGRRSASRTHGVSSAPLPVERVRNHDDVAISRSTRGRRDTFVA